MRKHLLRILLMGLFALTWQVGQAQDRVVTGKVTSAEDGQALPGVSVIVKGTAKGALTDANGNYKIAVPSGGSTLVFSFIGMIKKEVAIGNSTVLNVQMAADAQNLNEVVVTALGIKQEKKALGYAVAEVKGDEVAATGRSNFLDALQSRVPGLSGITTSGAPGASSSINLRGFSSIGGNNQPLFVIDGLPVDNRTMAQGALGSDQPNRNSDYANRISDINPNDIESISILKGPEAAALYGIDAANGAIVITTKKGKVGTARVNYDNRFRFEEVYRFPDVQKTYSRGIFGLASPTATTYFGPKYPEGTQFYDNIQNFFRTGTMQNHNLSIDGGSDRATYRFSTNYSDWKGTAPGTAQTNFSTKITGTIKLSPKMEVQTSLNYIKRFIDKNYRSSSGFLLGLLYWPANDDARNYLNGDGTRRLLLPNGLTGEPDNPYFSVNKNNMTDRTSRTIGNVNWKYSPVSWLSLEARLGADIYTTNGNNFSHPESNILINSTTGGGGATTGGALEQYVETSQLINANFLATLKKSFGKLNTSLLLGTSIDDKKYEVNSYYGEKFYLPEFNSINNTDITTQRAKYYVEQRRLLGAFGSFSVDYDGFLFLNVTGRNDWSSTLPEANRSFFYPSTSLSFAFTEIPTLKGKTGPLTFGKIRASYAEVGKDAPPYKVQSALAVQTTTGGGFIYGFFGGNPNLRPERTRSYEFGTELKFFQGRLGIDLAYFNKESADQIVTQRTSYGTGFILALLNGGTFSNQGVEFQLTGKPVKTKDFTWDITANFTKLKTSVKNLPADVAEYYNSDTWLYNNARASAFVGNLQDYYPGMNLTYNQKGMGSATAIGGYSYLRNNNGDVLINPSNGLPIINQNFLPIGDRNPSFTISWKNEFTFKNFNLSFLLDLRKGGDVFNGTAMYLWRTGLHPKSLDRDTPMTFKGVLRDGYENTATPTVNTIQITPSQRTDVFYSALPESEFVEKDINWLRLRDITLSYNIPLVSRKVIKNLGVYVTGTDLFLLTNYTGTDPNVNGTTASSGGVGAGGFDFMTQSLPRAISMGIRIGL
ncbi:MAG: SusC/RagA family TonB-linked outer membrane protein [Spirosomataceae bacterium]